jgi:hypothetical protein
MAHYVRFTIPERDLGKADVEFSAWSDGEKIGTLRVSKGAVVWFPKDTTLGYKVRWARLGRLLEEFARSRERR